MIFFTKTIILAFLLIGCAQKPFPNQKLKDQKLISFQGKSLADQKFVFPKDILGKPHLLLFGYVQETQFDIDRWLIGLDMTKTQIDILEVPTINGFVPSLISDRIDSGMRRGIPKGLWKIVVTVYDDGKKVQKFTGNERPNNARVMLIDKDANIRFFTDQGFSVNGLNELRDQIQLLNN